MKLCQRGLNFVQISDDYGKVRICTWTKDAEASCLVEQSFADIWMGERTQKKRERLAKGDYSLCIVDDCPYLSKNHK